MLNYFKGAIKSCVNSGDTLVVAVSGGADSVCLLGLLSKVADALDLKLVVAHFNHKIRLESDQDEVLVRQLAKNYGFEFVSQSASENLISEDQARQARYVFLEKMVKRFQADSLVLAHHADDQIETFWLHLLRGSGVRGLSGMKVVELRRGYNLLRPLLGVFKKDILVYNKKYKLEFCEDVTNSSNKLLRNRIRLELLPELAKNYNQGISKTTLGQVRYFSELAEFLSVLSAVAFKKCLTSRLKTEISLSKSEMNELPGLIVGEVVLLAVQDLTGARKDLYQKNLEQILKLNGEMKVGKLEFTGNQEKLKITLNTV